MVFSCFLRCRDRGGAERALPALPPTLCSEMFQIKPYADKPSAFGLSVHSFVSYERIGKWDEERYRKGGRKSYFIKLGGTPRWINLYAVVDADVYYNYEA